MNSICNEEEKIRIYSLSSQNCTDILEEDNGDDYDEVHKSTFIEIISPETSAQLTTKTILIETTIPLSTISQEINIPHNIETTFPNSQTNVNSEICQDKKKIFYEGKCICNMEKEYFMFNHKSSDDKCYKRNELPENIYFNKITKSFELCYKTCGTCEEEGNYSENNCLTCAINYIKEPEKNSSNCVEKCQYYYYYDSLEQYSCTEDEQCPNKPSLLVREKNKCISKCLDDDTYKYQYNGECVSYCPINTKGNENYICQLNNTAICSSSEFKLDLDDIISQENVKLVAKNYAKEFSYAINHVAKFISSNFSMVLYKNSSCIDELKMNVTKIEFDSCIKQLKNDNNINENQELIVAVIDIVSGINPITSFGFFDPDKGEKLNASKSCSNKNVMMYENILNILNDPSAIELLENQKINIFDLNSDFYKEICFHFNSPNGQDATLQDRIKSFYPNIALCNVGCKNKGINLTTMEAECECIFQDLLDKNIFGNDLIGKNILVKESLQEIADMINEINLEILSCYKDVFDFEYFKKNRGGFIVIFLFILYTICVVFYSFNSKIKLIRYIYSLLEKFIFYNKKENNNQNIKSSPVKKNSNKDKSKDKYNGKYKNEKKVNKKYEIKDINSNKYNKNKRNEKKYYNTSDKEIVKGKKRLIINNNGSKKRNSKSEYNLKQINIINFNFNKFQKRKEKNENISLSSAGLIKIKNFNIKTQKNNSLKKYKFFLIKNDIDLKQFLEPTPDYMDFDDVIEEDKRTFFQFLWEKIKDNQIILQTFFITEIIKPKSIKIAIFIIMIDIYFLTNGLFYSDSYISEIYNSTEKEKFFSFIPRAIDRFLYSTIIGNIIEYIFKFFFIEELKIKKILIRNKNNIINLKFQISKITKLIIKYKRILIIINYIIIIFSWYYLSCFNNVYPNINKEWILSSLFIIIIIQIIPFISTFLEACVRFISIKCESEKLFKISRLLL